MPSLVANLLIISLVLGFGAMAALSPDVFYQQVQEDQPLEWLTFWAFAFASMYFGLSTRYQRRAGRLPWFLAGLSAFCFIVAMEEISWGQRVLGYQAPRYFLEHNYQQELNFHNVVSTDYRMFAVAAILAGYGLLLPLLARIRASRRILDRLDVHAPPTGLSISFGLLVVVYVGYPWRYTGEVVEAGMGLGFLFASFAQLHPADGARTGALRQWRVVAASLGAVAALGFGSAVGSRVQLAADPVVAEVAATEVRALEKDVTQLMRQDETLCGRHERLTHFATRRAARDLRAGRFASLVEHGLPEERAEFFIDPWSTAYWVRTTCSANRDKVYLYSFGPNRRRDSSRWKPGGDDIGVVFRVRGEREVGGPLAQRDD